MSRSPRPLLARPRIRRGGHPVSGWGTEPTYIPIDYQGPIMLRSILKSISIGKVIRQIHNVHARASALCSCLRNKRWWPRASEFVMIIRHDAQGHHQQQQQRMTRYFSASWHLHCLYFRARLLPTDFFLHLFTFPSSSSSWILRLGSPPERYYLLRL